MATEYYDEAEDLALEFQLRQQLDYMECKADPVAFMGRHVEIEEPSGKVIPLRMWQFQRDAVRTGYQNRLLIVLKARRLGLSWIALAFALWLAIFRPGIRILILCKNEKDASELLDRIRRMKDRILNDPKHSYLFAEVDLGEGKRDAVTTFDIGPSTIRCLVGTPAAARSETAGFVLCDEFAFQSNASEIWRGLLPTIEADNPEDAGFLWVVSTGDGDDNEFARQWDRASSGSSPFRPMFFPWMVRPGRTEAWKANQIEALGDEERFKVEYPEVPEDAFVSPDTVFVYNRSHISAAVKLGGIYDDLRKHGKLRPVDGVRLGGVDWGDHSSAAVMGYPLERGGMYVCLEHEASQEEPGEFTVNFLKKVVKDPGNAKAPLDEVAYDAAGQQSMRTFRKTARAIPAFKRLKTHEVAFGTYKSETIGYIRALLRRTAAGRETRVIAISPACKILIDQMRKLEQDPDTGKVQKVHDHNADALIALMKKSAQRNRASLEAEERRNGS